MTKDVQTDVPLPDPMDEDPRMHPRAARIKLAQAQDYLAHLEFALRAKTKLDGNTSLLKDEIVHARNLVKRFSGWADARIDPRRRLPVVLQGENSPPRREYTLFLDECGLHSMNDQPGPFPVFCLCGIIVDSERYLTFDRLWKSWKARWLGSPRVIVHEPEVRRRSNHFYVPGDAAKEQAIQDSLAEQLAELEFRCVVAVIDKRRFLELYTDGKVDDFLPESGYLMCVDFIFERFVHFLCHEGQNAYGTVVAESRGLREDAEVHAEFLRLQLEGTQWQAEHQFRSQLRPYIEFKRKDQNVSGLQIADLAARPVAEKVLGPKSTPARWSAVSSKFYDGGKERRSSYGLKVFPTPETEEIFGDAGIKTIEDALASPTADQQVLVQ
jgi:hypothetical protein